MTVPSAEIRAAAPSTWPHVGGAAAALVLAGLIYSQLSRFSDWAVSLMPVEAESPLGEAIKFFFYDTPKVLLLLTVVVFIMGVVRSFFSAEKTRALLAGRREATGNVLAAALGVVTPFCSCSAVPMFLGFVSAGVPLGVTFSFLISAPMVNEIALGLLFGFVGWKAALLYLVFGLFVAIASGWVIGRLNLEGWLEDWVRELRSNGDVQTHEKMTAARAVRAGADAVRDIVGKVWLWVVAGILAGALIHGYVPTDLMASLMGKESWWSVPAAVMIGIPLYSNHAGLMPVVLALLEKGAALGTVLAFMMAVTGLSLPEMIILRKVLKLPLLVTFAAVVGIGILLVGTLFNALI